MNSDGSGRFAKAIANNDIALVAWSYPEKIPGCLGFAVQRINAKDNAQTFLPAWVGFEDKPPGDTEVKTTRDWPVQKFTWRDLTAPRGGTYRYRVVPMTGTPGSLTPRDDLTLETGPVTLTADHGDIQVYFNRGILSTQALTRALPKGRGGTPSAGALRRHITKPGDPIRRRLAGQAPAALTSLLRRANAEGGHCYCALYELQDPELVATLLKTKNVHIILSNSADDKKTGKKDTTNAAARKLLHAKKKDISDRMLKSGHIGHNKFVIYRSPGGAPEAVLTGSTNWTSTGLAAQSNNAIVLNSGQVAKAYLEYWERLKADIQKAGSVGMQGPVLRSADHDTLVAATMANGTKVKVWYSPNTEEQTKPKQNAPTPVDLEDVFQIIEEAEQAVLFLAFIPGTPSIMDKVGEVQRKKPHLFIRGALTDVKQARAYIDLYHRDGGKSDARVVPALGIPDQFGRWQKELYKLGHAVIHDKIVVVDPFSPKCAVVTGSHNLGYKASYANDENLVILRGNREIAAAYAAHVLDVYDHYRWRFRVQEAWRRGDLKKAWSHLKKTDRWQDFYFDPSSPARKDFAFWAKA